ncbi:MAG: ATP-binding protein [Sporichthyaceae bacterium]|nr:ATP-binding protein [Sporichthyaceae bacterium]
MLRSFRVANHKSIRDAQELVLVPAYDKQASVLPVAGIFGANAAGKSNLVDALQFMQEAVRNSYAKWEPGSGVPRSPFRLDAAAAAKPSEYVVDLVLNGVRYLYGVTVDDERICEEWLYAYPKNKRRSIFDRTADSVGVGTTLPDHRGRSRLLQELTRPNATLLGTAARANQEEVMPVYEWFRAGIAFRRPNRFGVTPRLARHFAPDSEDRDRLVQLLRAADLGISDVELRRVSWQTPSLFAAPGGELGQTESADYISGSAPSPGTPDPLLAPETRVGYDLVFLHGDDRVPLTWREQSEGTLMFLNLLVSALQVLQRGGVFCIDEIDASLHPRLTTQLIRVFQDPVTNREGGQLVFTTHDATLLGTAFGEKILDRDQIWFVEKASDGATILFPLTDFHPRDKENTERRYLGGSYGAVPEISDVDFRRALLVAEDLRE